MSIRYHIVIAKKQEVVVGPDDADIVVTVPKADVGSDPAVLFMQGKLKASGPTGALFDAFRSGEIAAALAAHAD